jgi:hypothetical protein
MNLREEYEMAAQCGTWQQLALMKRERQVFSFEKTTFQEIFDFPSLGLGKEGIRPRD